MADQLAAAATEYLADCRRRNLRTDTLRYYELVLRRFRTASAMLALEELTVPAVRAFQDASTTLTAASVRGYLRALKTFSAWLATEGKLPDDPLRSLRLPRTDRRVISVPVDDELVRLFRAAAPPLRICLAILAGAGMRIGDLTGLDLDDVRPAELVIGRTKNRDGRLLPLDPVLEAIIASYRLEIREAAGTSLLIGRTSHRLTPRAIGSALADAAARAHLHVHVSPHVLRHWYARDLAGHGTSERLLAARMGWKTADLVARYAPVGQAELIRDTERYAPLVRMRDEGLLEGLFPSRVLRAGPDQRSKNIVGFRSASTSARAELR